ncbi:hypothetical protein E2C01_067746 [Portunus trituberculatus]|uniref:Uncharacterized protein n=1 Tax=Portunus trituberculatus TaxID=210409 RepID=A0A5B7HUI0_PORTR|nr:hypothetical protein [Portunus trituberculatus]
MRASRIRSVTTAGGTAATQSYTTSCSARQLLPLRPAQPAPNQPHNGGLLTCRKVRTAFFVHHTPMDVMLQAVTNRCPPQQRELQRPALNTSPVMDRPETPRRPSSSSVSKRSSGENPPPTGEERRRKDRQKDDGARVGTCA